MRIIDKEGGWFFEANNIMVGTVQSLKLNEVIIHLKIDLFKKPTYEKPLVSIKTISAGEPDTKRLAKAIQIINSNIAHAFRESGYIDIEEIREEIKPINRGSFEDD